MVMASDECGLSVVVVYGILYMKFRFKRVSFLKSEMAITTSDLPEPDAILQFLLQTNGSLEIVTVLVTYLANETGRWT